MPSQALHTYSNDPASSDLDAVRFLIGDTGPDSAGWLLSDQEILYCLSNEGHPYRAAAAAAETLAMAPAGIGRDLAEKRVGDLVIRYGSGRVQQGTSGWYLVARELRRRAGRRAVPYAGGIDTSDRLDRDDSTLVQPAFTKGQDDDTVDWPF